MKPFGPAALALVAACIVAGAFVIDHGPRGRDGAPATAGFPASIGDGDDADAQAEMDFLVQRDPRTGAIPRGIRSRELGFARALPHRGSRPARGARLSSFAAATLVWTERGPNNVGGRTRALAVDVGDPSTLIAGAVSGGIWRSSDGGASWSLRTAPGQIHYTTCIAQDRRPGRTGTWYVGTGEIRGSMAYTTVWGSVYPGDGIFKSTDGGLSWSLLPSTSSGTPQAVDAFDDVANVATNAANATEDEVLAATHTGILRSLDGGGTWSQVLASDSGFTDVAVNAAGVMYAATRVGGGYGRVWRSVDGSSWTPIQPPAFPGLVNRVVIGLAPSAPTIAWFFIQGADNEPSVAGYQLWKYTYLSGDGSGAGGTWENRSAHLPADIDTQTGYDQLVQVKPDDEDFLVLGGTNLYRSTDGFASAAATTVIGGYPFTAYGHHPDAHAGAFSPGQPDVYYSATDGGVAKAPDITRAGMQWTNLDRGYNVTQFYSVALDPEMSSDLILAGAQDNGSLLGNAPGLSDWTVVANGDGAFMAVAPAADGHIYTEFQRGQLHRRPRNLSAVTALTPDGSINPMFVNPFLLDPNDSRLLYYAAGAPGPAQSSMVWRNDDAPVATTTAGWVMLTATNVGPGDGYNRRISALGISTANRPDVLYLGTIDGIVKKATGANGAPVVTDVTPPGLGGGTWTGGYVRCIAVDPTSSDRALVAFGNYNFPSLWLTEDGGASWTDVEGNLAGPSGPSVRWATMVRLGSSLKVFLGTSIGVLSTDALAGSATVWVREAVTEIGNVLVAMMDYRASDRTLAVATHGRGVFTTQLPALVAVGDEREPRAGVSLGPSVPNPAATSTTISFELAQACEVSLDLYDLHGRRVAALAHEHRTQGVHRVRLDTRRLAPGVYGFVLRSGPTAQRRTLVVRR